MFNAPFDAHDHRSIAQRLGLLHFEDHAPGMIFWHPAGWTLYRALEDAARKHIQRQGYREVRSPQLMRQGIWESSGHWEHFLENMFVLEDENRTSALKPVSCPAHLQIARQMLKSHRDLPLRLAEFGLVHRNERSGSLHGFFRLRQFTQDDGHIFCRPQDVPREVANFCRDLLEFYAHFGFNDVQVALSLRPEKGLGLNEDKFGSKKSAQWDAAEAALAQGLELAGLDYVEQLGEGAFYGPKIEFLLPDGQGRRWQCGTIQLDFFMPPRFDLTYVDAHDERHHPAMLHRAIFGSLERFMALLLERHQGQLPIWLAIEQVRVLPVADVHMDYAQEVLGLLQGNALRASVISADESLGRRIAEAHKRGVPWVFILGDHEVEAQKVTLRENGNNAQRSLSFAQLTELLAEHARAPYF